MTEIPMPIGVRHQAIIKTRLCVVDPVWIIEIWNLFVIWSLVLGISLSHTPSPHTPNKYTPP